MSVGLKPPIFSIICILVSVTSTLQRPIDMRICPGTVPDGTDMGCGIGKRNVGEMKDR